MLIINNLDSDNIFCGQSGSGCGEEIVIVFDVGREEEQ
jgi:hypothetical protein